MSKNRKSLSNHISQKMTITRIINIVRFEIETEVAEKVKQAMFLSFNGHSTNVSNYDRCINVYIEIKIKVKRPRVGIYQSTAR